MELIFVLFVLGVYAIPVAVIVAISSKLRKTPMGNGFRALGWSVLIWFGAAIIGGFFPSASAGGVIYVAGMIMTLFVARRGGYRLDWQAWVLLFLSAPGYWLLLWRRENALWRLAHGVERPTVSEVVAG